GDRIVVYRDPIVRGTIFIDRLAAPFQTVVNSILQYSFAARSVRSLSAPLFTTPTTAVTRGALPVVQPGAR
ncbi:MAG: hypothetical protein JO355_12685, partial [Planctomycetaceae bacterium]|nr:hypothetical protein [Planctomycetaceae bacterium]